MFSRKASEQEAIIKLLEGQQKSLESQLKMIVDLIRLSQLLHDRLVYLEGVVANGN